MQLPVAHVGPSVRVQLATVARVERLRSLLPGGRHEIADIGSVPDDADQFVLPAVHIEHRSADGAADERRAHEDDQHHCQ